MATAQNHATQAPDLGKYRTPAQLLAAAEVANLARGALRNRPFPNTTAAEQVVANSRFTAQGIAGTGGGER